MAICPNSLQIDDFNGNIVYSGPWKSFTNQDYGFNGTRHVAAEPGLSANFKFNGTPNHNRSLCSRCDTYVFFSV